MFPLINKSHSCSTQGSPGEEAGERCDLCLAASELPRRPGAPKAAWWHPG